MKRQHLIWYRFFLILFLLSVVTGCSKKTEPVPPGIIQPDEMSGLLTDIHIAQAAAAVNAVSDSVRFSFEEYSPVIFKNHHTSKQQFDSSLEYYSTRPELLDSIYKQVIDSLSSKQGELDPRVK